MREEEPGEKAIPRGIGARFTKEQGKKVFEQKVDETYNYFPSKYAAKIYTSCIRWANSQSKGLPPPLSISSGEQTRPPHLRLWQ